MKKEYEIDERINHLKIWIEESDKIIKQEKDNKDIIDALNNKKLKYQREIEILKWVKNEKNNRNF